MPGRRGARERRVHYEQLELGLPETTACPDKYSPESTLYCPGSRRLILQVGVNAAKVQLGKMRAGSTAGLGGIDWQPHETFLPCLAAFERDFDAVRVHNRYAGKEAQVLISAES
jgi:hypothetical protein